MEQDGMRKAKEVIYHEIVVYVDGESDEGA